MNVDMAIVTAVIGVASAVVSAFVTVSRYTSNLKLQLQALKHENQMQNYRLDSALQLLDKRIRDLEKHSSTQSGFVPHHKRSDATGSPWLSE